MDPEKYYRTRLDDLTRADKYLTKEINYISVLRLTAMILFIFFLIRGVKQEAILFIIFSLVSLISFFGFVSLHKKKSDKRHKKRILIRMNRQELKALEGDYHEYNDGAIYLDPDHEFTYDLDIFGPSSLYQYVCRCCTLNGERILAQRFLASPGDKDKILTNQQIHDELSRDPDFMQNYLSSGKAIEEKPGEIDQIKNWLNKKSSKFSPLVHALAVILSVINITLIISAIFFSTPINYLIISILVSWFFYGMFFSKINHYHSDFGRKQEIIKKYNVLSKVLSKHKFSSAFLSKASKQADESLNHFRQLEKLMDLFDSRLNLLVGLILNTLFLLDFHLILLLEKWKNNNKALLLELFEIHAETDAYISGGIFLFNHPAWVKAELNSMEFSAKKVGHPLIKENNCILNDFKLDKTEKIIIITGANMAGKSTFLRTIGVNLILAGAGFPVFAEEFKFQGNQVITGMRTTDSLTESESYFFAELKRMKRIMDRLRRGEKLFVLLDEILKGTNSKDKHKGSEELLKQIADYDCKLFIATHDLELSKLENSFPESIRNYHFESYVENDELRFDYKIRRGRAQNMNASFLLRKMGILK